MTISFSAIPVGTRTPGTYVEFDASRATNGLPAGENRVLLIGQRLSAGTIAAGVLKEIGEAGQAIAYFGRGSMLARMAKALKGADRLVDCRAIAVDDNGAGTQATGTITVTGPAGSPGSIALMVAGQSVAVKVASGDSATAIAGAIAAAVNAAADLPVTAASNAEVATLTARHKGTAGNEIDVRHSYYSGEALPQGVTLAIVAMSGGATDPDLTATLAAIGDAPFSAIVIGVATASTIAALKVELDRRFGPTVAVESLGYAAKSGTLSALTTFGASLNANLVTILGTGKSPTPPWEAAAAYAGIVNQSTNIDPARPVQTLSIPGMLAPIETSRFTRAERELLLKDAISTFTVDPDGTVRIERAITTYQSNAAGIDDVAWLDVETVRTVQYLRYSLRARFASKYQRHKLADDETNFGPGQAIVTPKIARAELIALAREWEFAGLVENLDAFVAELIVQRNASDRNRLDVLVPPDIVNQLRQTAAQIQFRL